MLSWNALINEIKLLSALREAGITKGVEKLEEKVRRDIDEYRAAQEERIGD